MSEAVTTRQQELAGKYRPYPKYKDSGVVWLGEMPSTWVLAKTARYFKIAMGQTILKEQLEDNGEWPVYSATEGDHYFGRVNNPQVRLGCGDLVIPARGNSIGFVKLVKEQVTTTQTTIYCKHLTQKIYPEYAYYFMVGQKENLFWFTQTAIPQITVEEIGSNPILLPSFEEQRTIAAFLDYETAQIDRLIAQQQLLIELLKEKRQAVISHAVRTRASEGHIKLAYAINLLTGYPFASSGFKSTKDTHIPLLRGANVGVDQIKWDDVVYWDSEDCSHLDDYYLERGDIVFGMDRPWISSGARVAEITQHDTPCLLLQRVARIRAKANHFQSYIKLCLSSNEFRNYVEADLTGVSVPHISPDQIKGFLIRNLPYDEQVSVTNEVLQVLEKLNAVERAAFNAIELLQERRTALISAAVTGKIDLRGWTPPAEEVAA